MAKKSAVKIAVVIIAALLLLTGVNAVTAPLIEQNGSSAMLAPLFEAMPEAKSFDCLYDGSEAADITAASDKVTAVYAESSGLGYVVTLSTTEGYTKEPMLITAAIDAEGKIINAIVNEYPDSKDFGADYPLSYIGQDSALADVSIVAGVTYSSAAFKNAISDAFTTLIDNGLVGAGVKGDDQILLELLPSVFTGIANAQGVAQYEETEMSGCTYLVTGYTALNGSGAAYIAKDGESSYLVLCNHSGAVAVYDVNGENVTENANSALIDEAKSKTVVEAFADSDIKKLKKMAPEGSEISELALTDQFSTVTGAYSIVCGDEQYFGFVARPYGYSNIPMIFYYVIDSDGAVTAMTAKELILEKDYFKSYELDEGAYKEGFIGLTADSYTGSEALISGATLSSEASDTAAKDCFSAFASVTAAMNGGENNG